MEKEKPRIARLTAIITQLQSKRMVTAAQLARKHDVSVRTIYRDIRTLEKSGVPILIEEGKGYKLMDGYKLPPISLTEEEANAMMTAESIIIKNKDQSFIDLYLSATTKIKSVLKYSQQEKIELLSDRIQIRNNEENNRTSQYLITLQSAIVNFQIVKIKYTSQEGGLSERSIEPFAMYSTNDNWIMIAYCRSKNDFRAFRLDRINQLIVSTDYFSPHEMSLEQYFENCRRNYQQTNHLK